MSSIKTLSVVAITFAVLSLGSLAEAGNHYFNPPSVCPPPVCQDWYLGVRTCPSPCGGLRVTWVQHGSPACRAGIECGDVLLKVNGRFVRCSHDLKIALRNSGGFAQIHVRDVRFGRIACVSVRLQPVGGSCYRPW